MMYYIAMFMCTITDLLAVILAWPTIAIVWVNMLLHTWKDTLQERREQSDLRSLEGEDEGGSDG